MSHSFTTQDAADIALAPYLAREQSADAVRAADAEREAARSRGVHFGGLEPQPINPRTPEQRRAAAEAAAERAASLAASPRGRFLLAIRELQELGYAAQTEPARDCMSRGFCRPDQLADAREVGRAIALIEPINHPEARKACLALAELLWAPAMAAE